MEKQKTKYGVFPTTLFMVKRAARTVPIILVCVVLTAAVTVVLRLLELYVTPVLLAQILAHVPFRQLLVTILLFTGGMLLAGGALAWLSCQDGNARIQCRSDLASDITKKVGTTSYCNLEKEDFREKLRKAQTAVAGNLKPTEAIWKTLTELLLNVAGFVCYLFVMRSIHPFILVLTAVVAVVSYAAATKSIRWWRAHRKPFDRAMERLGYLQEETANPTSAKDIRILHMQGWLWSLLQQQNAVVTGYAKKVGNHDFAADAVNVLLVLVRNGAAYAYLIAQVLDGRMDAAEFVLYFSAVSGFTAWVQGIMEYVGTLKHGNEEISHVMELLEYEEPFAFGDGKPLAVQPDVQYELALENVSFRYPGAAADTLKNVNLTIHKGEKLAIVGRNGAGKTTLVKLLCGFYDPTEGRVLLNGEDVRGYNRADYYRLFSAVFQDFSILPGTIAENIAQSAGEMDMERVRRAARDAGLAEKIEALPDGYDTKMERSVYLDAYELSGGETQRLMLARALYRNAPIIVLDEPTAALDPIAESELYGRYHALTKNATSVYVSHRLASTRFCDRIILIGEGGIAEVGTHDELMAAGKEYAHLFEVQSKYYTEGAGEE